MPHKTTIKDSRVIAVAGETAVPERPANTIAAQLVENQSQEDNQQKPQSREAFSQLLLELRECPSAIDVDVQSNHKLISVVVEAGFPGTTKNHGYKKERTVDIAEVLACLDVIQTAVERTPEVIIHLGSNTHDVESETIIWLLPKLFGLFNGAADHAVQTRIRDMVALFLSVMNQTTKQRKTLQRIVHLYQVCIDDSLVALEKACGNAVADSNLDLLFLSSEARSIFCGIGYLPVASRRESQLLVSDASGGFSILLLLHGCLSEALLQNRSKTSIGSLANTEIEMWLLRKLQRAGIALETWLPRLDPDNRFPLAISALETALCLTAHCSKQDPCATILQNSIILVTSLIDLASTWFPEVITQRHNSLVKVLQHLMNLVMDSQHDSIPDDARSILLPSLSIFVSEILSHSGIFQELHDTALALKDQLDKIYITSQACSVGLDNVSRLSHDDFLERGGFNNTETGKTSLPRQSTNRSTADTQLIGRGQESSLLDNVCDLFAVDRHSSWISLSQASVRVFGEVGAERKVIILDGLRDLSCSGMKRSAQEPHNTFPLYPMCDACGHRFRGLSEDCQWGIAEWQGLYETITAVMDSPSMQLRQEHRISLLLTLRALLGHSPIDDHRSLSDSPPGKLCLQSLRSSSREIRLTAIHNLRVYLEPATSQELSMCRKNKVVVMDFLRSLLDSNEVWQHEVAIMTMGQIISVCDDEEGNMILLGLVEFLGPSNAFISTLALLELRNLVHVHSVSPQDLFKPFWRTIAITAVKDLITKPQKTQQLAEFMGLTVNQFLSSTQPHTIPWLVLWGQHDILNRLAGASIPVSTIWGVCLLKSNLPPLLALLLIQEPAKLEVTVLQFLLRASPEFKGLDASNLLRSDVVHTACEVLKLAGDEGMERKSKALHGFQAFVTLIERKPKGTADKTEVMATFFEKHALGMMTNLSELIDNPGEPVLEKKRCLRAIEAMIQVAQSYIGIALPQVRACLQSAIESDVLRDEAFNPWSALLGVITAEDALITLIGYTFTAIVRHWDTLSVSTQQQAYDSIAALLKRHGPLLSNSVAKLPTLGSVSLMTKFESQFAKLRNQLGVPERLSAFADRCRSENAAIIVHTLREISPYLNANQSWIHESSAAEQPCTEILELVRVLLDICARYDDQHTEILTLTGKCLGIIGSLDPNVADLRREKRQRILILTNFNQATEAVDFVSHLLENVLVKSFRYVSNPRAQGFLAYVMQELLQFCGFTKDSAVLGRGHSSQAEYDTYQRWVKMSESARNTLTPFLTSRYVLKANTAKLEDASIYPIFNATLSHGNWLRSFVFDLLHRTNGGNAKMIFGVLSRIIRGFDVSISSFLLPYAVANILIGGTPAEVQFVTNELLRVLESPTADLQASALEATKLCSENVFQVLDYLSEWLQEKKRSVAMVVAATAKAGRERSVLEEETDNAQVHSVESIFSAIPADVISKRAVECGSFARALFYWEAFIRQHKERKEQVEHSQEQNYHHFKPTLAQNGRTQDLADNALFEHLHSIYAEINEPDGLSGISSKLLFLSPEQQIIEYRNSGRWAAAQSWYELRLREVPNDLDLHISLLSCLQQAGQHGMTLERAKSIPEAYLLNPRIQSIISEAAWSTANWNSLERLVPQSTPQVFPDANVGIATAMLALRNQNFNAFTACINDSRISVTKTLTASATDSMQTCHDQLLKLHALYEVELLVQPQTPSSQPAISLEQNLAQRMALVGTSLSDKQYLLNIRRAVMELSATQFSGEDFAKSWLLSAKLARKSYHLDVAYNAVVQSMQFGDEFAQAEQARLFWTEGQHRKAIGTLERAILLNAFAEPSADTVMVDAPSISTTGPSEKPREHNLRLAKAQLLLAKWLDRAGQTQSNMINLSYQKAVKSYPRWESGYYHLGKFYNKLYESEKALPNAKQSLSYLTGEGGKLIIENYLRSMMFGSKYLFETLPKVLTLWLDLGIESSRAVHKEVAEDLRLKVTEERPKMLANINKQVKKNIDRIPPYLFYTALPQMITRISHPHPEVYKLLALLVIKVVVAFPQQGLWALLALGKSSSSDRASRGHSLLSKVKETGKNIRNQGQSVDLKNLVTQGQRLCDQLLHACELELKPTTPSIISLTKDLGFNPKVFPCGLVIPLEKTLFASLPTATTTDMRHHKAFPATREAITFSSCLDDVQVLSSLQKPRKLTFRATDGHKYAIMIKPKDDLRKDQRLMEFNTFVNRSLRKDAESSKRRLYIKTYAVTPLNEECGLIEWVDGLKPLRDIISSLYKSKNIRVDYTLLKQLLDEACSTAGGEQIFSNQILSIYKPVLHEWFTEHFPNAEVWFAARLRYTRSCAITSMLGYALGLGDRHGENVLLEEKDGGVFHVDFNCLFDKGLTFEKPELVPFRLTHNMVDAFGAYGVDGPFRRSAECAMSVMRTAEDALLTILETFVYDPTADFASGPRRRGKGVPETPKEMLDSVKGKIRGLMRGESVPLSVEGHVDALIRQATGPANLCAMYIGWCAFL